MNRNEIWVIKKSSYKFHQLNLVEVKVFKLILWWFQKLLAHIVQNSHWEVNKGHQLQLWCKVQVWSWW
jgi:hypothetical protein